LEPIEGNTFQAIVFTDQVINALIDEDKKIVCSSINGKANVDNPIKSHCENCLKTGKCQVRIRLWLMMIYQEELVTVVMSVRIDKMQEWQTYKLKLNKELFLLEAVNTLFMLTDNGRIVTSMSGLARNEMLLHVKRVYKECEKVMNVVSEEDF